MHKLTFKENFNKTFEEIVKSPRPSTGTGKNRSKKSSSLSSGNTLKNRSSQVNSPREIPKSLVSKFKQNNSKKSSGRGNSSKASGKVGRTQSQFSYHSSVSSLSTCWTWDGDTRTQVKIAPGPDRMTLDLADSNHAFDVGELTKYGPEYRTEPYFELTGEYSYGYAENFRALHEDKKKNFKPQLKRLQREGGKSIELYEDWRMMQYKLNIVIKRFLVNHGINSSVLPPCTTYDMWRDIEWRELYKEVTGRGLDEDPCPDCDVRFFKDKEKKNKYIFKIAPSSILEDKKWQKRRFLNTVLVVGLPQHITIACCREHCDHVVVEFFDPAGPSGDLQSVKAVKQWAESFLKRLYSRVRHKQVIFKDITKSICFQADASDVMCQTWIWYWVYWRMVRQATALEITKHVKELITKRKSLSHVQSFNKWMIELYKLGYLVKENGIEAAAADKATPPSFQKLVDIKQRKIMRKIELLQQEFASAQRTRELCGYESSDNDDLPELDDNMVIKLSID